MLWEEVEWKDWWKWICIGVRLGMMFIWLKDGEEEDKGFSGFVSSEFVVK